jgi:hypothetical protein
MEYFPGTIPEKKHQLILTDLVQSANSITEVNSEILIDHYDKRY